MTLCRRIIPCLDVTAGRGVKGVQFENLRDAGDPVELARTYDAEGADELTFLDISASHEGRATTLEMVSATAEQVFIPLTVGGGIRSVDDVDIMLRAGADKIAVNTASRFNSTLATTVQAAASAGSRPSGSGPSGSVASFFAAAASAR